MYNCIVLFVLLNYLENTNHHFNYLYLLQHKILKSKPNDIDELQYDNITININVEPIKQLN